MSDETTLLPCPFCGGEAQVQHQSRELYGDAVDWYGVYCKKQFCGYVSGQSTEAEAIAAWNTRAEREKRLEELARSLYADYHDEWPDRAEEVYAERMRELGIKVIDE